MPDLPYCDWKTECHEGLDCQRHCNLRRLGSTHWSFRFFPPQRNVCVTKTSVSAEQPHNSTNNITTVWLLTCFSDKQVQSTEGDTHSYSAVGALTDPSIHLICLLYCVHPPPICKSMHPLTHLPVCISSSISLQFSIRESIHDGLHPTHTPQASIHSLRVSTVSI